MALKDWKKIFDSEFTIIYQKDAQQIVLGYDVKSSKWFYQNASDYSISSFAPLTKAKALRFARAYMRSH